MKSLSLAIQKIWPMLKVFADRQTDRRSGQKLYAPDLSIRGHKKHILVGFSPKVLSISYLQDFHTKLYDLEL
jgi:hypothetical protein